MAISRFEADIANIQKLDDEPNDVGGLTAEELKAEFDKAGLQIQEYINDILIPGVGAEVRAAVYESGAADMNKAVYDTQGRETDIFGYVDSKGGDDVPVSDDVAETFGEAPGASIDDILRKTASIIPKIVSGVYVGDGTLDRVIPLNFTPTAVIVMRGDGGTRDAYTGLYAGGLATTGGNVSRDDTNGVLAWDSAYSVLGVTDSGFKVTYRPDGHGGTNGDTNTANRYYMYIAFAGGGEV